MTLRLAYLGTPDVGVPPLLGLLDAGFEIPLVVSGPDKRRGRGSQLQPSPVKAAALDRGLVVTDRIDDVLEFDDLDLGVVVAYGHLIRPHVLEHLDMVNLHFSLLPRWRGAAPVERALLAGDAETGVCVMQVEEGLDTGGVYRRRVVPIRVDHTLESLRAELVEVGTGLLVQSLQDGLGSPEPQQGEPTTAKKIRPEEYELDLEQSATVAKRTVRLGRAWTTFRGKRLRILEAEVAGDANPMAGRLGRDDDGAVLVGCGEGALRLRTVQAEGKAAVDAADWLNGAQPRQDERLGR